MAEDRILKYEIARQRREKRKLDLERTIQLYTWTWSGYVILLICIIVIGFSYIVGPHHGLDMVSINADECIASDQILTPLAKGKGKLLLGSSNLSNVNRGSFFSFGRSLKIVTQSSGSLVFTSKPSYNIPDLPVSKDLLEIGPPGYGEEVSYGRGNFENGYLEDYGLPKNNKLVSISPIQNRPGKLDADTSDIEYPLIARQSGQEGYVLAKFKINREGRIIPFESKNKWGWISSVPCSVIVEIPESFEFASKVKKAAWQWVGYPAIKDGKVLDTTIIETDFWFRLPGRTPLASGGVITNPGK